MATGISPSQMGKGNRNWFEREWAVEITRQGLNGFVQREIDSFQKDVLRSVLSEQRKPLSTTCDLCTTANLLRCPTSGFCNKGQKCFEHDKSNDSKRPNRPCPNGICTAIKEAICREHRYNRPSWSNTDARQWCSDSFMLAKCYMPDCYNGRTLGDTDLVGLLSIVINMKCFQRKMKAQLNVESNIASKALKIARFSLNSTEATVTDAQLTECFDTLRLLLQDSSCLLKDPEAVSAAKKLVQLQQSGLERLNEDVPDCIDQILKKSPNKLLRSPSKATRDKFTRLVLGNADPKLPTDHFLANKCGLDVPMVQQEAADSESVLLDDLVGHYKEYEYWLPLVPLVEEHAVPLLDFYVQPPVLAFNEPYAFGRGEGTEINPSLKGSDSSDRKSVQTFKALFFKNKQEPYKHIYLTAPAGMGKTSFSQKVAITWCQAHRPEDNIQEKIEREDLETMKYFDYVFLFHLRDYQGADVCDINKLVLNFTTRLAHTYTDEFIQNVLLHKKCLIIFDGLEEWAHPDKCTIKPAIPHSKVPNNYTTLTTARPWKLSTLALRQNMIDRHLEISELDERTAEELETNACDILNQKRISSGLEPKDQSEFRRQAKQVDLGIIRLIPFILLQLVCLWFDGVRIARSKSEIFSNVIELTLKWGFKKINLPSLLKGKTKKVTVPKCMENNDLSKRYIHLLFKVGKLAYFSFLGQMNKSGYLVTEKEACKYLSEKELQFCLKIGLMCQAKDRGPVSERRFVIYFQRQPIQEFFAAFYVATEDGSVISDIVKGCSLIQNILEMSNIFIFVSGLNTQVYNDISRALKDIVAKDIITHEYRSKLRNYEELEKRSMLYQTMLSYQTLQLDCFEESRRSEQKKCLILLQDVLINGNFTDCIFESLRKINESNIQDIKSLHIHCKTENKRLVHFISDLSPEIYHSLDTLMIESNAEPEFLVDVLSESEKSLKTVQLESHSRFQTDELKLTGNSLTKITKLKELRALSLCGVNMSHTNIERLFANICNCATMQQLVLTFIRCSDHKICSEVDLDLRNLGTLEKLNFEEIPLRKLRVNAAELEDCAIDGRHLSAVATTELFGDLQTAPNLFTLYLYRIKHPLTIVCDAISSLSQIRELRLWHFDIDDDIMILSQNMTNLEKLDFNSLAMTTEAWKKLFHVLDILQNPVHVEFRNCKGQSLDEWLDIVKDYETKFAITKVSVDEDDGIASIKFTTSVPTLMEDTRF